MNNVSSSFQYPGAVDELMKLTQLFVLQREDAGEEELAEIRQFRTNTLQLYLSILDGRSSWATLISALKILVQSTEDKLFTVCNNGLSLIYDAFNILHLMHHEATACHVTQVKYIPFYYLQILDPSPFITGVTRNFGHFLRFGPNSAISVEITGAAGNIVQVCILCKLSDIEATHNINLHLVSAGGKT